ncbi:DNA ligase-1 [Rhodoblastus acidophilus]|uniref:DNA ligase (ATP) n=1 Tax=Rhodoblastus acidophilus TaxID=1074 RepID=A0A212S086_RHOAC|nr:cisplatin damage response ATP-dependent DNA ligase [Rhodoblastus acidophilus]PPQ38261.1 ATP-dependent DNA ligase [Rhodoblastus acidophilus]RAI21788.1 ATP-dependent DNA ligase [Rhodoblastus acidophilus]SNB78528.1 DNA ligase-1 [Rhodoblastus acidophilus]
MKAFARLLEDLLYQPARNGKLALLVDYLAATPDPDRGYALAALCSDLVLDEVKPALLRGLIEQRADPILFRLSYDFVGDLSETIALMWEAGEAAEAPGLAQVVETLRALSKAEARRLIPLWLDALDGTGRWALLKLVTGALRVGVSTGLAKQALAQWSGVAQTEIEEVWHGFAPPYLPLFAWLSGAAARPSANDALCFHSPMLAQPIDDTDFAKLAPTDFCAEWKWDGVRVQLKGRADVGARLFSRSGDDISAAFPDLVDPLLFHGGLDGELVALEPGESGLEAVASFSTLQQRLNRKTVSAAMMARIPVAIVAYDLLFAADSSGEHWTDIRPLPFQERRALLEQAVARANDPRLLLSPLLDYRDWESLAAQRAVSAQHPSVEGVMLKRKASPYLAGRPKGEWFKWKRDAHLLDCVMMYAQRGHGKRASLYSDYTFGLWSGDMLLPVGKSYFGFTDAELAQLDRFVRQNTTQRFGPVREVVHSRDDGLVLEIAFEGVQVSARHKSGYAMRFPRINRIRRDKKPGEADLLESLAKLAR